ncbi:hypothetical protein [Paenibacillus thalictri]|uniref:Uncharacterized protein n=1 Tax=Paenibacillus thalictri TaxID=2527873 RepID=A0A4Q9DLN9_9BACL|nr:hypothetical protein [Paenibacillus thalictri]TBL76032.1 hypothetical protein EYB31_21000 [Paenibacillus thalictri]
MSNCSTATIVVGVGDTVRLPIRLRSGERILKCISRNCSIATCSSTATSASVTGRRTGTVLVAVLIGIGNQPIRQAVFCVRVIEEHEE